MSSCPVYYGMKPGIRTKTNFYFVNLTVFIAVHEYLLRLVGFKSLTTTSGLKFISAKTIKFEYQTLIISVKLNL